MKSSFYSMCAILAGILWGIISIFLKGLYAVGFSALQVMFFRGLFSSFFMAIFLFIKDKNLLKIKDIFKSVENLKDFATTEIYSLPVLI